MCLSWYMGKNRVRVALKLFMVLEFEPRTLHMLCKDSIMGIHPYPLHLILAIKCIKSFAR